MMKKIRFNYSLRNIPLPSPDSYTKRLIENIESVIIRMRWKAHFFLNGDNTTIGSETFRLNSKKSAPHIDELNAFEEDLVGMVENIKFRNVNNQFLSTLANDAKKINSSPNVDKTRNIYVMKPDKYKQLLTKNVTAIYKLGNEKLLDEINQELKTVASDLHVEERIETMARKPAFISLEDHKENFENNTKPHLINSAKSNLGKVSKAILDGTNISIRASTGVNQWRSSTSVTEWFNRISEKSSHTSISFDIVDFYPSISKNLLDRAISWGQQLTTITPQEEAIIKPARKSFLFHREKSWIRRGSENIREIKDRQALYSENDFCVPDRDRTRNLLMTG